MDIVKNALIIAGVDMIWLFSIRNIYGKAVEDIQGSPMQMRHIYAIPVYLALGYLLSIARNPTNAFLIGLAAYSVYDFTLLALFKKYTLGLALADAVWGGVLLGISYHLKTFL